MDDAVTVNLEQNSPEYVAYLLLKTIAAYEEMPLGRFKVEKSGDRKWLLDTYAECLLAVRFPERRDTSTAS
jgi:hypothetical protein